MKHLFNKLKSAFLVLMTVVISLPLSSFTAGAMAQPPLVDNPACDETVASGNITLCKTAQPVPGMVNTWDITLKIKSKKVTTTSDTVLVIDRSGSMDSNGRMPAAKTAARSFVNTLLPAGNTTNHIALVSFAGEVQTNSNFTNNAATLISAIDGLNADGGTYTQAAIHQAQQLLASSTADYKTIVLLSDGEPTYSARLNNPDDYLIPYAGYGGQTGTGAPQTAYQYNSRVGSGSSMLWRYYDDRGNSNDKYYNHGNSTIAEAGFAKNAGGSTIYTVALEADAQGNNVLNAVASPGNAYTANPADLQQIFDEIAGKISNFIKDASVVDQMGDGIIVENGDKTINWTPTLTQEGDFFVAEKTYRIQLDGTKLVDGWYDANQIATLTYNGGQTADFPVPKVDPTFVKIEKKLDGDDCASCEFTFELTLPSGGKESHSVKLGEVKTLYHPMPVGNYSIVEASAKDAGGNAMSLNQYDVSIVPATFALSQAGADVAVLATNKLKTTDVSVRKQWTGKPGTSATVTLHADGVATSHLIELNAGNDWKHTFTGLRKHNRDGSLVKYTIVETPVAGYEAPVYSTDSGVLVVTNKYVPKKINITGKKAWVGGEDLGDRPTVELQLYRNGIAHGTSVELAHPNVEYEWKNVDETDIDGNVYTYTVDELAVPAGYTKKLDGMTVTNTYESPLIDVSVRKEWVGGSAVRPIEVWVNLYRKIEGGTKQLVENSRTNLAAPAPIWNKTWKDLDKTDSRGNVYEYSVEEEALSNFTPGYSNGESTLVVTNTYQIPTDGEATAVKTWTNGPANHPTVWFKLYRQVEGGTIEPVPTDQAPIKELANGTTSVTWDNLQKTDGDGKAYTFSVKEVDAGGNDFTPVNYEKTENGLTVTNKYVSPKTDASVLKDWKGGAGRPTITVNLLRDGVVNQSIVLNEDNSWTHTWKDLPKTDDAGKAYVYTVEELTVDGYKAVITSTEAAALISFVITNTYQIPTDGEATAVKTWTNGPANHPTVWFKLYRQVEGGTIEPVPTDQAPIKELANGTTSVTWNNLQKTDGDGKAYTFSVKEVKADGSDFTPENYTKTESGLSVTNKYVIPTNGQAKAAKVWEKGANFNGGVRPTVWFKLYRQIEGGVVEAVLGAETKKLADGTTEVEWTGLEKTDINGKPYTFTVKEVDGDGNNFTPANYDKVENGLTVTNTYESSLADITAEKKWVNGPAPVLIEFQLWRQVEGGVKEKVGSSVALNPGELTYTWKDQLVTDQDGKEYAYSVKEITALPNYDVNEDGLTVTNTYKQSLTETDVIAQKKWVNGDADNRPEIKFELWRKNGTAGTGEPVVTETVVVGDQVNFGKQFKTDINGVEYEYFVKEVAAPTDYEKKEDGLTVTNTYVIPTGEMSATKSWINGPVDHPTIWFKLYRQIGSDEAEAVPSAGIKELTSGVESVTWDGVELTNKAGKTYVFSVLEVDADGNDFTPENYAKTEVALEVVNTYEAPTKNISVKKNWVGGQPTEVEVALIRDGIEIEKVKLNQANNWQYIWEDMPLTDIEGNVYVYQVKELTKLDSFRTALGGSIEDGFLITNTWFQPGEGGVPNTGVGSSLNPLMMLFALALIALGVRGRKLAKQTI